MNDPRSEVDLKPAVVNKHEALIAELADLLWPVIRERIVSAIDARISYAVEHLIDDKLTAAVEYGKLVTENDLDQRLTDYTETVDLDETIRDTVRDWANDSLSDSVRDVLRHELTLTVQVD